MVWILNQVVFEMVVESMGQEVYCSKSKISSESNLFVFYKYLSMCDFVKGILLLDLRYVVFYFGEIFMVNSFYNMIYVIEFWIFIVGVLIVNNYKDQQMMILL